MTAHIIQNVVPRNRPDFRTSLKWVRSTPRRRKAVSSAMPVVFQTKALGQQLGSIDHHTITLSLGLLALVTVFLLGFFLLQQVIGTASQGSDVHALESEIVSLKEKQRQLELDGAELRSIKTIEQNIEKLNLVATDKVSYISGASDHVALGQNTASLSR